MHQKYTKRSNPQIHVSRTSSDFGIAKLVCFKYSAASFMHMWLHIIKVSSHLMTWEMHEFDRYWVNLCIYTFPYTCHLQSAASCNSPRSDTLQLGTKFYRLPWINWITEEKLRLSLHLKTFWWSKVQALSVVLNFKL